MKGADKDSETFREKMMGSPGGSGDAGLDVEVPKKKFVKMFKNIIRLNGVNFDWEAFCKNHVVVHRIDVPASDLGRFAHPWYVINDRPVIYKEAAENKKARALRVGEAALIDADDVRRELIENLRKRYELRRDKIMPIPVGESLETGNLLLLGNNFSAEALHRLVVGGGPDIEVELVIVEGHDMRKIIVDMEIVDRAHPGD